MKKKRKKLKIIAIPFFVIAMLFLTGAWYVNDYYHTEDSVQSYMLKEGTVKVRKIDEGLFLDGPGKVNAVIFYPGAKVEYTAYVPLLYQLAEQGVDCFLTEMPFNLAILGQNKAGALLNTYDYENWYLSGHSLGGAMGASYASGHLKELDGLILLAAYPTKGLKTDAFSVLTIYGSEDGVLNMKKYEEGKALMPDDYTELCVEGGCHAYFGNYGEQKGDGTAKISREEQQKQTVEAVLKLIKEE